MINESEGIKFMNQLRFFALTALIGLASAANIRGQDMDSSGSFAQSAAKAGVLARSALSRMRQSRRNPVTLSRARILKGDSSGCTWVESSSLIPVGEENTREQVRSEALSRARLGAVEEFLGVNINSRYLSVQHSESKGNGRPANEQLVENVLRISRRGRIFKEKIVSEGYQDAPNCSACLYRAEIRACVAPVRRTQNDLSVRLSISRSHFVENDSMKARVFCSQDCFVYIYDVGPQWQATLLSPSDLSAAPQKLSAGESWTYPDAQTLASGLELLAQIPKGQSTAMGTIHVIAVKKPLSPDLMDPANGGYLKILRQLNNSGEAWAEDEAPFVIYKK